MKYSKVLHIDGEWRVLCGSRQYFAQGYDTEHDAKIAAIQLSGRWYQAQIDRCQRELEELDPGHDLTDWLA